MAEDELRKAFSELMAKKVETSQRVKLAQGQIQALKVAIRRSELTEEEVGELPDGTNTYQSVGRMFLLSPRMVVQKALRTDREEAGKKIKEIETNIAYWERSLQESEGSLRELVSQRDK